MTLARPARINDKPAAASMSAATQVKRVFLEFVEQSGTLGRGRLAEVKARYHAGPFMMQFSKAVVSLRQGYTPQGV